MTSAQRGADSQTALKRTRRSEQAAAAVAAILVSAAPAEVDHLLAATNEESGQTLDTALWGDAPSMQDIAAGVLDNLRKQFKSRRDLELASVSRAEAAELLGTSEQAVTDALEVHRLLGFKRGRRWFIPAWQFDPEAERGVLQGLDELSRVFPGGIISLSSWVNRPSADFHDRSPRDELVRGKIEPVVRLARSLTAVGW